MGGQTSIAEESPQKSQVIHSSEIINSRVQFASREQHDHQYLLNTTVSFKNRQYEINQYLDSLVKACHQIETSNLYLPVAWEKNSGQMCEQFKDLQLYYPVFNFKLRSEIEARKITREGFSEPEIWYLLMSILNGIRQFEKLGCISSELCVNSVRMNADGLIKIQNYLSTIKDYEEISDRARHRISILDYQIHQTYNIGLILLQTCTYAPLESYSASNRPLQPPQINNYIQKISYEYSELLCALINVMMSSFSDRPLPSQIYQIFAPFKEDIMNFRPFDFSVNSMKNSMTHSKATIPYMYQTNLGQESRGHRSSTNHHRQFQHVNSSYNQNPQISPNSHIHYISSPQQMNYPSQGSHYMSPLSYQNHNNGV